MRGVMIISTLTTLIFSSIQFIMTLLSIAIVGATLSIASVVLTSYMIGGWVAVKTSPPYSFADIPDLTGKVVLVTGANTGIGYVTARELARKGAQVIATSRSVAKGEAALNSIAKEISNDANKGTVEYLQLDLASWKNVKEFSDKVKANYPKIDILILNAGIMMTPFQLTEDGYESQIATNHFGHFILVKNLFDTIVKSKTRVVYVSSIAHFFHYNNFGNGLDFKTFKDPNLYDEVKSYGQTKLSNILVCNELSRRLEGTGATCNSLHPGSIKTELLRSVEGKANPLFKYVLDLGVDAIFMKADDGALTQLYVATAKELEGVTGKYFTPINKISKTSPYASNIETQKVLWSESEIITREFWQ